MSYRNDAIRDGLGFLLAAVVAIAVFGLIVLVGWQAGWWFRTQDTNRQAQLDKQGIGYQLPLQTQIGDEIGQVLQINSELSGAVGDQATQAPVNAQRVGVLDAQRKGTVVNICQKAAQVNSATPLSGDQAQFVADNCFAGTIKPGSPYNH